MTLIRGVLGLLLMVAACNRPSTDSHTAATATVPESESNLSIEKAQALLKPDAQGQLAVQLIDVRTQSEWATGYIPGADVYKRQQDLHRRLQSSWDKFSN